MLKNIALVLSLLFSLGLVTYIVSSDPDKTPEQILAEEHAKSDKETLELINKARSYWLPPEATEVKHLGNYWFTFTLQNRRFMFHHGNQYRQGYESIVELRPANPQPEANK
jgi:hypothetical protein